VIEYNQTYQRCTHVPIVLPANQFVCPGIPLYIPRANYVWYDDNLWKDSKEMCKLSGRSELYERKRGWHRGVVGVLRINLSLEQCGFTAITLHNISYGAFLTLV